MIYKCPHRSYLYIFFEIDQSEMQSVVGIKSADDWMSKEQRFIGYQRNKILIVLLKGLMAD